MCVDYGGDNELCVCLDELFFDGWLVVFWSVVDDVIGKECGLLEVSEVVELNLMDFNVLISMSNLFNCVFDGVLLYVEVVVV